MSWRFWRRAPVDLDVLDGCRQAGRLVRYHGRTFQLRELRWRAVCGPDRHPIEERIEIVLLPERAAPRDGEP